MSFATYPSAAAGTAIDARSVFIVRTYAHLFGAIAAFVAVLIALFQTGASIYLAQAMLSVNWLFVIGAFMIVSWIASHTALRSASLTAQYAALAGFVIAESVLFVPLIYIADYKAPGVIESAAIVTMLGFAGLTAVVFVTRKNFSFLGGILGWAFVLMLLLIVGGQLWGYHLGTLFSVAMVGLSGLAVLYDTSKVLHEFPEDRYVGAALELFASVALMFWYVLRLFSSRD